MRQSKARFAAVAAGTLLIAGACGQNSHSQEAPGTRSGQAADESVVATIGERVVTMSELDSRARTTHRDVFQALYDARLAALETLVAEALLDARAQEEGVSREELVEREIVSKVAEVTDEDVAAFFAQNQARLGGQTIEQIGGQIREFLNSQQQATQTQLYLDGLRAEANVTIDLSPPRVDVVVARGERISGPEDAAVTIVEYSDFQ